MDNLCHTLMGAAFGEAGLKRRTRYGNATLMIAANLPDIDVLAFASSAPSVAFRRGWTHGLAAQALLPMALTAIVLLIARTRTARDDGPPVRARWLLLVAYVGVLSHVYLDLLNNYGVRLLTPFNWHWFYGDAVFILDPWLWLALGVGVWQSRRRAALQPTAHARGPQRARLRAGVEACAVGTPALTPGRASGPARMALVVAALYIAAMGVTARVARERVLEAWQATRGGEPRAFMVGPMPITPFHRTVVVDAGDHYETGTFAWFPARVTFDPAIVPKHDRDPRVARAREAPHIRGFLVWSRFPFWTLESTPDGTRVSVGDMRFAGRGSAFVQSVVVR